MYMWVYEEYTVHRLKGESVSAADSNFWMSATDTWTNSEQFTCLCADKDILGPS